MFIEAIYVGLLNWLIAVIQYIVVDCQIDSDIYLI